jgi:hypothetical protein
MLTNRGVTEFRSQLHNFACPSNGAIAHYVAYLWKPSLAPHVPVIGKWERDGGTFSRTDFV